jgi:toxin YoeB
MNIVWSDIAWDDYIYWQNEDRKTLKKINDLIKDIERNGYKCIGKPEPLKGNLSGYWSVRIDKANRLVFKIESNSIKIAGCKTHYNDK